MAKGRDKWMWNHTACVVATILNSQGGIDGKPVQPAQYHPYEKEAERQRHKVPLSSLKSHF